MYASAHLCIVLKNRRAKTTRQQEWRLTAPYGSKKKPIWGDQSCRWEETFTTTVVGKTKKQKKLPPFEEYLETIR
jgi:hypothetical protein